MNDDAWHHLVNNQKTTRPRLTRRGAVVAATYIALNALVPNLTGHSPALARDDGGFAREAERQQREAARDAQRQQREAERQQREAARQAEQQQREAARQAAQQQRDQDRQQRDAQKAADQQARDAARQQQQLADQQRQQAQADARRAEQDARAAAQAADRQQRDAAQASDQNRAQAQAAAAAARDQARQAADRARDLRQTADQSPQVSVPSSPATSSNDVGRDTSRNNSDVSRPASANNKPNKNDDDQNTASDDSNGDSKNGNGSSGVAAPATITTPPRTIVEMFQRLAQPAVTAAATPAATGANNANGSADDGSDAANNPGQTILDTITGAIAKTTAALPTVTPTNGNANSPAANAAVTAAAQAAKKAVAAAKAVSTRKGPPVSAQVDFPSLGSREILATNLSPSSLQKLLALGFQARGSAGLSQFDMSITRLAPPAGMATPQATQFLREQLPDDSFAQNKIYRAYRAATAPISTAADTGTPKQAATNVPCDSVRCYGPLTVGWSEKLSSCAKSFGIGVIDTPVDINHPTFKGRQILVQSFVSSGRRPASANHGTGVLAMLAGRPDSGTPGLVPDAHFFAADVFFADDGGQPMTDTISILKALDWLNASNVKVINMSVAGPRDELVEKAIIALSRNKVIITAAAGNGGPGAGPSYPAAYAQVISVTAVDRDLRSYRHANQGAYIDVAAPGVGIWTAYPGASEGLETGTSFAVPYATATLAALYSTAADKSKDGLLSQVQTADLGPPGRDAVYGRGLLKAPSSCTPANAVTASRQPSEPMEVLPWADRQPPSALGFTGPASE